VVTGELSVWRAALWILLFVGYLVNILLFIEGLAS
jgi:hypothetical protein